MSTTVVKNLQLLRFADLKALSIIKNRMTLKRWLRHNKFPAPVRLGKNSIAWRAVDVERWLQSRSAAQQEAATDEGSQKTK